jgi:hypothetical protein
MLEVDCFGASWLIDSLPALWVSQKIHFSASERIIFGDNLESETQTPGFATLANITEQLF